MWNKIDNEIFPSMKKGELFLFSSVIPQNSKNVQVTGKIKYHVDG